MSQDRLLRAHSRELGLRRNGSRLGSLFGLFHALEQLTQLRVWVERAIELDT